MGRGSGRRKTLLIQKHCVRSEEVDLLGCSPPASEHIFMNDFLSSLLLPVSNVVAHGSWSFSNAVSSRNIWKAQGEGFVSQFVLEAFVKRTRLFSVISWDIIIYISTSQSWIQDENLFCINFIIRENNLFRLLSYLSRIRCGRYRIT